MHPPIPVAYKLTKLTGSDDVIENLHWALYKRKGKVCFATDSCGPCSLQHTHVQTTTRKRDIGKFSGFVFAADKVC